MPRAASIARIRWIGDAIAAAARWTGAHASGGCCCLEWDIGFSRERRRRPHRHRYPTATAAAPSSIVCGPYHGTLGGASSLTQIRPSFAYPDAGDVRQVHRVAPEIV